MKSFYKKSLSFWFVLLILAFVNATIQETTYKPLLTPYIGVWAHQISSVTGILFFYGAIYFYLNRLCVPYTRSDIMRVGFLWSIITFIFESIMNAVVRKLPVEQVIATYYFWRGDTWIFVFLSLVVSPVIADRAIQHRKKLSP